MHPVDLDKLLETVPQPYEPVKHADSPVCILEFRNETIAYHTTASGSYKGAKHVMFHAVDMSLKDAHIKHEMARWLTYERTKHTK